MRNIKYIVLFVIFFVSIKNVKADRRSELIISKLQTSYTNSFSLKYRISVSINSISNVVEKNEGFVLSSNGMYIKKEGDEAIIINNSFSFIVNDHEKYIIIDNSNDIVAKAKNIDIKATLDSMFSKGNYTYKGRFKNSVIMIETVFENSPYKNAVFYIDTLNYTIKKINFFSSQNFQNSFIVSVNYYDIKLNLKDISTAFSHKKYFSIKGAEIILTEPYKYYKVIDKRK